MLLWMTENQTESSSPLLFFRLKVEYSKLLLCEQTHHPITITVQQQTSGLPNNNNNINHNGWQPPYVSHSNKCCLTNETQIIQKTTYGKPSPIIWTACCSVFSDEASNCPTVILKWVWNQLCFNSIMRWDSQYLCTQNVCRVLLIFFCNSFTNVSCLNLCHSQCEKFWSELFISKHFTLLSFIHPVCEGLHVQKVITLTVRQSEIKHLLILFLLYNHFSIVNIFNIP